MMEQMQRNMGAWRGGAGFGAPPANERKGTSKRDVNREKVRKEKNEAFEKSRGPILVDPYFNIVEVTIYGQARFFNPPPADGEAPASPGDVAAAPVSGNAPAAPGGVAAPAPGAPAPAAGGQQKPDAAANAERPETTKAKDADKDGTLAATPADGAAPKAKRGNADDKAAAKSADPADSNADDVADQPAAKTDASKPKGASPKP
jgi:hypothetical protein